MNTFCHKELGPYCPFFQWTIKSTLLIALVTLGLAQEPTDRVVILPIEKAAKEAPLSSSPPPQRLMPVSIYLK